MDSPSCVSAMLGPHLRPERCGCFSQKERGLGQGAQVHGESEGEAQSAQDGIKRFTAPSNCLLSTSLEYSN